MTINGGSEQTAIAVIPANRLPTLLQAPGAVDKLKEIRDKVAAHLATKPDVSRAKDRDAMRSLAREIASAKIALDNAGKNMTETWRTQTAAVNAERAILRENMEGLQDEIRAPLTEWENREKRRVEGHEAALSEIAAFAVIDPGWLAFNIASRIDELEQSDLWARDWQEFKDRAMEAGSAAMNALRAADVAAVKREDEARELAELRAMREQAERLAREREEEAAAELARIKHAEAVREAAEAARVAAEEEAARKAEEAAQAAQREREAAAQRERDAAEALRVAEEQRIAAEDRMERTRVLRHENAIAEIENAARIGAAQSSALIQARIDSVETGWGGVDRDWQEFSDKAADARKRTLAALRELHRETEEQEIAEREAARVRAEQQAALAQQAAVEAERVRLERAQSEAEARRVREAEATRKADAARARNVAHQRKINGEALADLMARVQHQCSIELSEALARAVIIVVAKGEIRHMKVEY